MRTLVLVVLFLCSSVSFGQSGRPQTPEGPFPYRAVDVDVPVSDRASGAPSHTLGATITLPDAGAFGGGPYPGVVLMSGSGMQDRDSMIFEHRPFLVIADFLTRRGIAVLRYDDRAVGASTGTTDGMTTQDLAHDGHSAIMYLRGYEGIDPARVGVIGHSEGGGHVAWIGARDEGVAFLVSLAGVGVRGLELMLDQTAAMFRDGGQTEAYIEESMRRRRAVFEAGIRGDDEDEIVELIALMNQHEYGIEEMNDGLRRTSRHSLPMFAGDWMRSFADYDPGADWARCTAPALVMNGSKDFQVSPEMNLGGIRRALIEGGHEDYTIIELGGLNHLFQPAGSGMLVEYAQIEQTFDVGALELLGAWIESQVGGVGE